MGGPASTSTSAAAYAAAASRSATSDRRQRLDAAVHSLRQSTQHGGFAKRRTHVVGAADTNHRGADNHDDDADDDNYEDDRENESDRFLDNGYANAREVVGDYDGEDDEDDGYQEEEVRAAAAALEREEMKKHFNFPLEKRRGLASHLASAMRKKRRLLLRNENLRFRELYKAPEPMVLLIAASLVAIVTLILTKSWPFY